MFVYDNNGSIYLWLNPCSIHVTVNFLVAARSVEMVIFYMSSRGAGPDADVWYKKYKLISKDRPGAQELMKVNNNLGFN